MWWLGYGGGQLGQRNYLKMSQDQMRREFCQKAYETLSDKLSLSCWSQTRRKVTKWLQNNKRENDKSKNVFEKYAHSWGEHTSLTGHHAVRTWRAYRSRQQLENSSTKHWEKNLSGNGREQRQVFGGLADVCAVAASKICVKLSPKTIPSLLRTFLLLSPSVLPVPACSQKDWNMFAWFKFFLHQDLSPGWPVITCEGKMPAADICPSLLYSFKEARQNRKGGFFNHNFLFWTSFEVNLLMSNKSSNDAISLRSFNNRPEKELSNAANTGWLGIRNPVLYNSSSTQVDNVKRSRWLKETMSRRW